jgi:acyl-CoA synthetase (AMP-forming)/AMP-acid ligase II
MPRATKKNAILDRWRETASKNTNRPAVFGAGGGAERTFAQIEAEAEQWAARLAHLPAGAVMGIQLENSPAWPGLVLGAMRRGLVPLPLGTHMAREERELALATCGAAALILGEGRIESRPGSVPPGLDGCDFLKLTSGTTSQPRAIRFTAAQLAADCDNICETMGIGETDLNYGLIPFSHSYGFSNLITPLLCRGVALAACDDRMPRAILDGLLRTGASVFPGMPVFFEKLAAMETTPPALRLCISAGAPLPARVGEAFSARHGLKVHTFYGSSECGGIAYDAGGEPVYEDGFAGTAMRNVEITFSQSSGQIVVRSEAVGDGYYPDPDPDILGGGRFIPGDLVRFGEHGMYLEGRATDVINIAGRKLNPAEVEARLARCPGVRQVVVFGIASPLRNEEAVACVSGSAGADEVLRYARAVLSGWQVPKDIWRVEEVPVNDRGKISRKDLAISYASRRAKPFS